jgi:uncharacterized protein (TIGR02246 family)
LAAVVWLACSGGCRLVSPMARRTFGERYNTRENVMKIRNAAALFMMVTVVACAPMGSQPSPQLAAMDEQWEAALNSGDMDALVAMYTEDARVLPPNAPLAQGRAAVKASFQGMMDDGLKGELETVEARVAGDMGYRLGTYVIRAPDGSAIDRGKYIETWRNEGGTWRISNDIWNSDLAPAGAETTTLVITHEVEDAGRWLAAWRGENSRHQLFAEHGVAKVRTFQDPDTPNRTAVVMDVADMAAFEAVMASPTVASAKKEDGVKDATLRVYSEVN